MTENNNETSKEIKEINRRYREAREKMEQVYKDNYDNNAYGYEDGYLDGLETAINILDDIVGEVDLGG